jgi:hypothetical protein
MNEWLPFALSQVVWQSLSALGTRLPPATKESKHGNLARGRSVHEAKVKLLDAFGL